MAKISKALLAENVAALARARFGDKFQGELIKAGISNGNVTRVLKGQTSVGLDVLDALSKALRVPAWTLLTPNLDPKDLPILVPKHQVAEVKAGAIALEALRKISEESQR